MTTFSSWFSRSLMFLSGIALLTAGPLDASAAGWNTLYTGDAGSFTQFLALSEDDLVAATSDMSNAIMYSQDGGYTWEDTDLTLTFDGAVHQLVALSDDELFAVVSGGSEDLYKSTDGGQTWASHTTPGGFGDIYTIDFVGSTGYAAGSTPMGDIYKSTDDGDSWSAVGASFTSDVYAIDFLIGSVGVLVGENGKIATSSNSGVTWTQRDSWTLQDLNDVTWTGLTEAWAVGNNGVVLQSTDTGATWTNVTPALVGSEDFHRFVAYDSDTFLITGEMTLFSTDGGDTWSEGEELLYAMEAMGGAMAADDVWFIAGEDDDGDRTVRIYDETAPSDPVITAEDGIVTNDATPTFSWVTEDNIDNNLNLNSEYYLDGIFQGITHDVEASLATLSDGDYTFSVTTEDPAANTSAESTLDFTIDTTDPTVDSLDQSSATQNSSTTLSATVSDATSLTCYLVVNGTQQKEMTVSGSTASTTFTFTETGSPSAYVTCDDEAGNRGNGSAVTMTIAASSTDTGETGETTDGQETEENEEGTDEVEEGTLMKMPCEAGALVNDPCKAVYWYGTDGKRHAFPNEKVYFTWFDTFDDVVTVTEEFMASVTLGVNVTYHPGSTMVKFQTVNTVYVVEKGGVLRAVPSEEVATDLYGSAWNTFIHDISDAFFSNYTFGDDLEDADDHVIEDVQASVDTIDDNF